jgi:diguanylate cyclase (GGDEF)-like protein
MPKDETALTTVFQPIINLVDGKVIGYEALGRLQGREEDGFGPVLEWARKRRRTTRTFRHLQALAFERAASRPEGTLLFLNGRLSDVSILRRRNESWSDVVLEVPESDRRLDQWSDELGDLRTLGLQVAIDDWGVGTADPLRLIQLQPQWVKIDVALVRQIDHPDVERLVDLLVRWVNPGTQILAEGIETESQLEALRHLGVRYGQGFALAQPSLNWVQHVAVPQAATRLAALRRVPMALTHANGLTDETLALIEQSQKILFPLFRRALHEFIDWLYDTPMITHFIGLDRGHHEQVLLDHFRQLVRGQLDQRDVDRAQRIARVHQQYSIDLSYYVTGYRRIQAAVACELRRQRLGAVAEAMRQLFDWDMSVVLQAYQQLLDRDALTGTLTRQAFWDRVQQDATIASAANRQPVLALFDIDEFHQINLHNGHIEGDRVLAQIGQLLQDFPTSAYVVGRIGGDVFGLWAPSHTLAAVRRDMQSLAQTLRRHEPSLTFSWGFAVWGTDAATVEELYTCADRRLYQERHRVQPFINQP